MTTKTDNHPPPRHLSLAMKKWHRQVTTEYELEPHHLHVLRLACESFDRAQQARKAIVEHGLTMLDRHGQVKARPECSIENQAATSFSRFVRELALDIEQAPSASRPQYNIVGNANRRVS